MSPVVELNEAIPRERQSTPAQLRVFFAFFIVSGFCALLYEVVWGRLAMASFGVTAPLTALVISMFMAGLGLGSWGAGILTRRQLVSDAKRALRCYALAEMLVGLSSIVVPYELKFGRLVLLHVGSYGAWQSSRYYLLAGIWIAITLVPWCTCMGATFPLLMAVIRKSVPASSEHSFSYLYVANVLGGLVGALASAFVFIEMFGFRGTLYIAGGFNLLLAIAALALSSRIATLREAEKPTIQKAFRRVLYGLSRRWMLAFLFLSGFVSMGLEVVWIRQFTPYLGNLVYAFASILAVYLLATILGSQDYRSKAKTCDSQGHTSSWTALALFAAVPAITADPLLPLGYGFTGGIIRLTAIALFCALAGFLTPMLVDSFSAGDPDKAGTAYAYNIAGSIAGPLFASFWLLPWLGERWAAGVLTIPLFAMATVVAIRETSSSPALTSSPKLKLAAAAIVAILIFCFTHNYENAFQRRIVKRDYAATVIAEGQGFKRQVLVNGTGMTYLTPVTKMMVHLPLGLLPRQPQNGLVICFGSGTSFRSMVSWGIPTTAVDLIPSVPKMFGYFHADASNVANSPLASIVIDDGRRFLDGSNHLYDVIVVDPPPPVEAAGSGLLYSREFFEVIKEHLRNDGIAQVWYPAAIGDVATSASVAKTIKASFPYVKAFESFDRLGIFYLVSKEPIPNMSGADLATRLPSAASSDLMEWGPEQTAKEQFDMILSREVSLDNVIAEDPQIPEMQDNQPINEYYLLRRLFHYYK